MRIVAAKECALKCFKKPRLDGPDGKLGSERRVGAWDTTVTWYTKQGQLESSRYYQLCRCVAKQIEVQKPVTFHGQVHVQ